MKWRQIILIEEEMQLESVWGMEMGKPKENPENHDLVIHKVPFYRHRNFTVGMIMYKACYMLESKPCIWIFRAPIERHELAGSYSFLSAHIHNPKSGEGVEIPF